MKDYSLNFDERKDFILGYDITGEGKINIKFANGLLWPIPYNKENEKKVLEKMEEQLVNSTIIEKKLKDKLHKFVSISSALLVFALFPLACTIDGLDVQLAFSMTSVGIATSIIPGIFAIKTNSRLKDLRKNIRFLEIKDELNTAVRKNENILVNVSKKTKNVVVDFPEDREVFDVNSFNYVPFKDLEQVMENVDRNERFGFDYDNYEEPDVAIVRKRVR